MEWKIWLAFGLGLIFGACGMAIVIGYLKLRADELMKKSLSKIQRVIIGYFVTNGKKEREYANLN